MAELVTCPMCLSQGERAYNDSDWCPVCVAAALREQDDFDDFRQLPEIVKTGGRRPRVEVRMIRDR